MPSFLETSPFGFRSAMPHSVPQDRCFWHIWDLLNYTWFLHPESVPGWVPSRWTCCELPKFNFNTSSVFCNCSVLLLPRHTALPHMVTQEAVNLLVQDIFRDLQGIFKYLVVFFFFAVKNGHFFFQSIKLCCCVQVHNKNSEKSIV